MVAPTKTTIEVDTAVADILRRADAHARARGETLSTYLDRALPREADKVDDKTKSERQWEALERFRRELAPLVAASVPPGHFVDDSRDSMYD